MKRRQPQRTDRPPIPERLRRYRASDWATAAEAMAGAPTEEDAAVLMVKLRRRWQRAQNEWAAKNGYSAHEMYQAQEVLT